MASGYAYRKFRFNYVKNNPLCEICKRKGLTVAGEELDHIIPRYKAPELKWDTANVQHLCTPCHIEKTRRENRERQSTSPEHVRWFQFLEVQNDQVNITT